MIIIEPSGKINLDSHILFLTLSDFLVPLGNASQIHSFLDIGSLN